MKNYIRIAFTDSTDRVVEGCQKLSILSRAIMRVSLIGHGRLGKLISSFLSRDVDLEIFDQSIDRPIQ